MQLSLHADYACRVLIFLASTQAKKTSIQDISAAYGISNNHLVKVAHRLGSEGFLVNTRGRSGGISLAKAPKEINIGDVIRKMEPHFDLVECFNKSSNSCPIIRICGLKAVLAQAREAFFATLNAVTLADITENPKQLRRFLNPDSKTTVHL